MRGFAHFCSRPRLGPSWSTQLPAGAAYDDEAGADRRRRRRGPSRPRAAASRRVDRRPATHSPAGAAGRAGAVCGGALGVLPEPVRRGGSERSGRAGAAAAGRQGRDHAELRRHGDRPAAQAGRRRRPAGPVGVRRPVPGPLPGAQHPGKHRRRRDLRDRHRRVAHAPVRPAPVNEYVGLRPRLPRRRRVAMIASGHAMHLTGRMSRGLDVGLHDLLRLDATTPVEGMVAPLNRHQPEFLYSYPSILEQLAAEQQAGRLRIAPTTLVSSGEAHTTQTARAIRAVWDVPWFDMYGATEAPVLGAHCAAHTGLHLFEDLTIVEVVDEHDRPVPAGRPGHRVLLTNLVNRTQPLIRYQLSDLVTLAAEPCPCGRPFRLLRAVDGRNDDILVMRDVPVHPMVFRNALAAVTGARGRCTSWRRVPPPPGRAARRVGRQPKAAATSVSTDSPATKLSTSPAFGLRPTVNGAKVTAVMGAGTGAPA